MVLLDASLSKEVIPRRSSEIFVASPNHSLKSSPVTPSPDLIEINQSPIMPEEVNVVTQPVQDEIHVRRYSVIGSGVPATAVPHQVWFMNMFPF